MSMIRTVEYRVSIRDDGSIFNETAGMTAEMDSMPLAQSQLDDANARIDQLRQAIIGARKQRDQGPAPAEKHLVLPPTDPSALKNAPGVKPLDALAYDRNKPGWVRCPKCGKTDITHDQKPPKKGTWQGCYGCGIFLNVDGTTAEIKPRRV